MTIPTTRLDEGLTILQSITADPGPDVLEAPEIISEAGQIGETTELMLKVKAQHGMAPQVRRRLLERIYAALDEHNIFPLSADSDPPSSKL